MLAQFSPIEVVRSHKDNPRIVEGSDGIVYLAKCAEHGAEREAYYYFIARLMHVPVPPSALLSCPDCGYCFGSQWEADMLELTREAKVMRLLHPGLAGHLSRICALDYLSSNEDRHAENILLRVTPFGLGVRAYDFANSHVLKIVDDPLRVPSECSNTGKFWRFVFSHVKFHKGAALDSLDRLRGVPFQCVSNAIHRIHELWPDSSSFHKALVEGRYPAFEAHRAARHLHVSKVLVDRYAQLCDRPVAIPD